MAWKGSPWRISVHLLGPWAPGVDLTKRLKGGWTLELQKLDLHTTLPARFPAWLMGDGRWAGWLMGGSRSHQGAQLGFRLGSSGEIMGAREMHFYVSARDLVCVWGSWPWALGLTAGVCVGFMGTVVPGLTCECCVFVPGGRSGRLEWDWFVAFLIFSQRSRLP